MLLLTALGACAAAPVRQAGLYDQLGGKAGIATLVDRFLNRVADDPRIVETFAGANIGRLRRLLEEQFCQVSDGPCVYGGESMEESHRGMGIRETEFNALVEDLIDAMEATQVPVPVQNRLLARLAPMHRDIVQPKEAAARVIASAE